MHGQSLYPFLDQYGAKTIPFGAAHQVLLPVFSVTPFKIDENKNQNRSIDKVRNLGNERR